MKIHGLEKLSLVDYDGYVAATVFTGGCNFRCPFCHNAPLVLDAAAQGEIPEAEILGYLKKRQGLLTGVCVTGGEPTLNGDLGDFLAKIKALGYNIKLDTNGTSPDAIAQLTKNRLIDYVAMDIKNCPEKYGATIGIAGYDLSAVKESVALLKTGTVGYEFRTTLIAEYHTATDIEKIGEWISGADKYFLQAFKDSENCIITGLNGIDEKTALNYKTIAERYVKHAALRGY